MMIALSYVLRAESPLLLTGLAGDANTKRSLDYIPGSAVRGALIARYLEEERRTYLQPGHPADDRLFLSPATCYLAAYPLLETRQGPRRGLPTPLSWRRNKAVTWEPGSPVYDLAVMAADDLDQSVQYMAPSGAPFCWQDPPLYFGAEGFESEDAASNVYFTAPARQIRIHTARARRPGRATRAEGAVFHYDALAEGERFAGVILAQDEGDAERLHAWLAGGEFRVGGSQRAGYGAVVVEGEVTRQTVGASFDESGWSDWPGEIGLEPGDRLRLTALSPWLLRTPQGQPATQLDRSLLAGLLGLEEEALQPVAEQTQRDTVALGGYHRVWGLPLPQRIAIAAGSTFVFAVDTAVAADRLWQLHLRGLGAQRGDGLGRVAINWQVAEQLNWRATEPRRAEESVAVLPPDPSETTALAREMAQRILRHELDRALAARIQALRLAPHSQISNSLLNRLRMSVRSALTHLQQLAPGQVAQQSAQTLAANEFAPLTALLAGLKPAADHQLRRTRLDIETHEPLRLWLDTHLEQFDEIWRELLPPPTLPPLILGSRKIEIPDAWKVEYTLRLIDGVLAQAARPKGES